MGKRNSKRGTGAKAVPLKPLALGVALAGIFIPLFTQSPIQLASEAQSMLATTGEALSASVPPNQYNTLAEQLAAKEQALNEREAELAAQSARPAPGDVFGFASLALSIILMALIGLNFYLDSRRNRKKGAISGKYSVDLS